MYSVTKTLGHELGLSAAFRQWRAQSHCHFIHGYALAIKMEFEATTLDDRNWVIDFGGFSVLRDIIKGTFDHKLLVASDDPHLHFLLALHERGLADVVEVSGTGCEVFAKLVYDLTDAWLDGLELKPRVTLRRVEVSEHGANSAAYTQQGAT